MRGPLPKIMVVTASYKAIDTVERASCSLISRNPE
jgi:hypothetical protein